MTLSSPKYILVPPPLELGDEVHTWLAYQNGTSYPCYVGGIPDASEPGLSMDGWYDNLAPSDYAPNFGVGPGSITYNSPDWIIATAVPEPTTLTLLFSALLGLAGAFYLRSRRATAGCCRHKIGLLDPLKWDELVDAPTPSSPPRLRRCIRGVP